MTDREKQELRDIAEDLLATIETDPLPCDFCYKLIQKKRKLLYEGRETKYCPFCGRKFVSSENP